MELICPTRTLNGVVRQAQEGTVGHARHLDRILEAQEDARAGAFLRRKVQQIPALVEHLTTGHLIRRMAGQHLGEGAFPRAVRPHDRVHFAGAYREIDALEDDPLVDLRREIVNLEQDRRVFPDHPTLPSSLRPSSLVASTANSIGSSTSTSCTQPLMIIETASSAPMPRLAK